MDAKRLCDSLNTKGVVFNIQNQVAYSSLNTILTTSKFNIKGA